MSVLYLSDKEKAALQAIGPGELEQLIDIALGQQRVTGLYALRLGECGVYVANQLRLMFENQTFYQAQ